MPYTLIEQINTQYARITFEGPFQGKIVTWDTHFFTVQGYYEKNKTEQNVTQQFINIKESHDDSLELTLALNILEINNPNIHKMMIMIKQYKNLTLGRHQYG